MASSSDEDAHHFALVSVPFKGECPQNLKRVIGIYDSRAEAQGARELLIARIPQRSGYIEADDCYWISYGKGADNEILLLIEPIHRPMDAPTARRGIWRWVMQTLANFKS